MRLPTNVRINAPLATSQMRTVWLAEPVTAFLPSALKADLTAPGIASGVTSVGKNSQGCGRTAADRTRI
jgi:hypothetical protein